MVQWKKKIMCFDRRISNTPKERLNQTSCPFPVAQALDRAAVDLGRHCPPCHEHRLSPYFSLLGHFGGQKVSAAHAPLKQALTWLHCSGHPTPRATKKEGQKGPGEKISQHFPFAGASWQAEAGSAVSVFLRLPAPAASQHCLGLALILPEPDLSFSSPP